MADNKEPIYEDTMPAVSLGDGPFTRKDTGDSGIGYCSIPSRGVGEFGIPSGIPEEMIRAVEMHEYMHLSLINMVPEIQDMHLQMRKDAVPDKIIQGVGDLIVNSISKDEHVRSTLEGLYHYKGAINTPKTLFALDIETGQFKYETMELPGDGDQEWPITIGSNGTIYLKRDGGKLYALRILVQNSGSNGSTHQRQQKCRVISVQQQMEIYI